MQSFFVQLDPNLQTVITFGLTALVTFLLVALGNTGTFKWLADYLGQYKAGIVAWLSGLVFNLLQNVLNQVPQTWDSVMLLVMKLIVEVAVVLFGIQLLKARKFKAFQ